MIYMDNAATTLQKPEEVKRRYSMLSSIWVMQEEAGTEAALDASRSIYAVREKLADFFQCRKSDKNCIYCKFYRES